MGCSDSKIGGQSSKSGSRPAGGGREAPDDGSQEPFDLRDDTLPGQGGDGELVVESDGMKLEDVNEDQQPAEAAQEDHEATDQMASTSAIECATTGMPVPSSQAPQDPSMDTQPTSTKKDLGPVTTKVPLAAIDKVPSISETKPTPPSTADLDTKNKPKSASDPRTRIIDTDKVRASSSSATSTKNRKASLKPGRSIMDWIKLTATHPDLAGTGGKLKDVTPDELAKHNTQSDCWICIKGRVYNVTPYLEFHPGGVDQMMRGAGTDATELFNSVHRWVNVESMLKKCLVGHYKLDLDID